MKEPWSKKQKRVFKSCPFSLSNSFAQPLSQPELTKLTQARNDNDLLHAYHNHSLEYTPNGGSLDLREEVSKLYSDKIKPENIIIFPGAQVAIQTAVFSFAQNCHSIVFGPGYQSVVDIASNNSVTRLERKASNRWQIDLEEVKQAIQKDTKFLVINEPYNPGGIVMSRKLQKDLIELCDQHEIVILSDEVYRYLEHDQKDRIPAMADVYHRGISVVTLSKPWGACGVTIGWLTCQNLQMKQQLVDVQYFATVSPSRASEIQAIMVLRASDVILEERLSIIRNNLHLLQDFVEKKFPFFFKWERPNAGPLTSEEFGDLLVQRGISIKPAYVFSDTVTPDNDYFRVGFGEKIMPLALQALTDFVEECKESWLNAMNSN